MICGSDCFFWGIPQQDLPLTPTQGGTIELTSLQLRILAGYEYIGPWVCMSADVESTFEIESETYVPS